MRINLKRRYLDDARRKILAHLVGQFCDEYDLGVLNVMDYLMNGDDHLSTLVAYLNRVGYRVSIYRLDDAKGDTISWGLEFDDQCELTLALKMRYHESGGSA